MGELIFFAVLILFSILESVARKRGQREGGGDEDPTAGGAPRPSRREGRTDRSRGTVTPSGRESLESAETMLPADLWEEIAGLAAGRLPQSPPEPVQRRPGKPAGGHRRRPKGTAASRRASREAERRRRAAAEAARSAERETSRWTPSTTGAHPIHDTHRDYGTDPSERKASELDWKPTVRGNENAKRVRALLRGSGGADALKQAVMLQEILGAPASMKDR